jgi:hypothetical protein
MENKYRRLLEGSRRLGGIMTREEFEYYKERFEREGYIHDNVVRELFDIVEGHFEVEEGNKYAGR